MDGFVEFDEAIKSESKSRVDKVEKLAGFSALVLLGAAFWLAWPTLKSGMAGSSLNSELIYALIIIAWGVFVQDLGLMDEKSRSRIGIIATVAWLPLAIVALSFFEGNVSETCGWQGGTNLVCRLTVNRKNQGMLCVRKITVPPPRVIWRC